jgi:hypothetical protein
MTIRPDNPTIAGLLDQLVGFLDQTAQEILAIKLLIADQTNPAQTEPDPEYLEALMRLKDDGCPNGD